jgi:hypothetical protein
MEKGEFYKMVIASSVSADGSENFDVIRYENEGAGAGAAAGGAESLFEQYDYIMHGKVFKYQIAEDETKM